MNPWTIATLIILIYAFVILIAYGVFTTSKRAEEEANRAFDAWMAEREDS